MAVIGAIPHYVGSARKVPTDETGCPSHFPEIAARFFCRAASLSSPILAPDLRRWRSFRNPTATLSLDMVKTDQTEIRLRIVIEQPVFGVLHSLQSKDERPLDPKCSRDGAPILFDFPIRVAPGPKFFGDQVRPEGSVRRFVYIRVGQSAGDASSPWSRRMKIDIHDIPNDLLSGAIYNGDVIETTINGTAKDGTPVCATVPLKARRLVKP